MSDESDNEEYYYYDDSDGENEENLQNEANGDNDDPEEGTIYRLSSVDSSASSYDGDDNTISIPDGSVIFKETNYINTLMSHVVEDVSSVLGIEPDETEMLFQEYKWNKERLMESFFSDPQFLTKHGLENRNMPLIRKRLANGIDFSTAAGTANGVFCNICRDVISDGKNLFGLVCDHYFCRPCYSEYLKHEVLDVGILCVRSCCPQPKCHQKVYSSVFKSFCPDEVFEKYRNFVIRSFVGAGHQMRYCPGQNCNRVALGTGVTSVTCLCGCSFCFRCGETNHSPCSCRQLESWKVKCADESETANWILINTKQCPKCRVRIEKNQGCNHMTCRSCKHEFCWICSGDWKNHDNSTGGFYKCNRFVAEEGVGSLKEASAALDRYIHYYSRYHAHEEGEKYAKKQLGERSLDMTSESMWINRQYHRDAVDLVARCRSSLKYTYVLGYFISDDVPEKRLFEHHQEMLEKNTEKLQELVEASIESVDRSSIVNLTRVTSTFLENLHHSVSGGVLNSGL